jgi:hypothetical protein
VADIAKLSVGREEYYTRELAETCISDAPCKVRTAAISRYLRGHQRLLATSLEDRSVLGSVETLENKSAAKIRRTTVFVAAACRIRRVPDSASAASRCLVTAGHDRSRWPGGPAAHRMMTRSRRRAARSACSTSWWVAASANRKPR